MKNNAHPRLRRLLAMIIQSRFLFLALLLHLVVLGFFGGRILYQRIVEDPKGVLKADYLKPPARETVPEPPSSTAAGEESHNLHPPVAPPQNGGTEGESLKPRNFVKVPDFRERGTEVRGCPEITVRSWESAHWVPPSKISSPLQPGGMFGPEKIRYDSQGIVRQCKFTCYVAQYEGGDWNANYGQSVNNRWYGNCIANLMLQVRRWSRGDLDVQIDPRPIALSSADLLSEAPPFVFLTGHKDFRFTEVEIGNLRAYLLSGGMIWADNALPGRKSRFDMAFRREMGRVLPGCPFEKISGKHPIFGIHYAMAGVPAGMNFYREPIEVIRIGKVEAVIYTLNAYSDLWETALTEKNEVDTFCEWIPDHGWVWRVGPHWYHNYYGGTGYRFFRNVTRESVLDSYRLGVNMLYYLLSRYRLHARTTL